MSGASEVLLEVLLGMRSSHDRRRRPRPPHTVDATFAELAEQLRQRQRLTRARDAGPVDEWTVFQLLADLEHRELVTIDVPRYARCVRVLVHPHHHQQPQPGETKP